MSKALREDGAHFHAVATVNARVRSNVIIYTTEDQQTPYRVHDLNLARAQDRTAFLGEFAEEDREELDALLKRLAASVAAEQAKPRTGGRGSDTTEPAPALDPWEDPVDGAALLDALVALLPHYVVLPEHAAEAIALWLVHTYMLEAADYSPYLLITSPVRECGKTTLLEILEHLAYRAKRTGGITAAALYRTIATQSPTMLLDELDTRLRGDGGEALRGVLNEGFQRGGKIIICVGDDYTATEFNVFCPKVLAGIGRVWDTVTSRSMPIRLERAAKGEIRKLRKIRGDRIDGVCAPYRRQLARWADDHLAEVRELDASAPEELGARQADVWRPLFAIAEAVGGEWPERAKKAAIAVHGIAEEEGDWGLLLLQDVRDLFEARHGEKGDGELRYVIKDRSKEDPSKEDRILPSSTIVEELVKREDRPWPEYRNDKPITTRGVASLLRRFAIRPATHRPAGGAPVKGYRYSECREAFARYLPEQSPNPPTPPGQPVTTVTDTGVTDECYGSRAVTDVVESRSVTQLDALSPPAADIRADERPVTVVTDRIEGGGGVVLPSDVIEDDEGGGALTPEAKDRIRAAQNRRYGLGIEPEEEGDGEPAPLTPLDRPAHTPSSGLTEAVLKHFGNQR